MSVFKGKVLYSISFKQIKTVAMKRVFTSVPYTGFNFPLAIILLICDLYLTLANTFCDDYLNVMIICNFGKNLFDKTFFLTNQQHR